MWKVLVVDDNPTVRNLIFELFTREFDFAVCGQAQNGRDALIQALELKPNLIVTDLNMPFMNGLEETNAFKTLMPEVPIILYSADMDRLVEKEAIAAGASAAISKTEVIANLILTARSLLEVRADPEKGPSNRHLLIDI